MTCQDPSPRSWCLGSCTLRVCCWLSVCRTASYFLTECHCNLQILSLVHYSQPNGKTSCCPSQLGVVLSFNKEALHSIFQVVTENNKYQRQALWFTCPFWQKTSDIHSLTGVLFSLAWSLWWFRVHVLWLLASKDVISPTHVKFSYLYRRQLGLFPMIYNW